MSMNFYTTTLCKAAKFKDRVRSRINWYEKGEKNSKYFLNLENIKSGKSAVRRLFDSKGTEGSITVDPQTFIYEVRDYYQSLNSNQDSDLSEEFCSDFLDKNYIPILSEHSKAECEGKLSCAKCYKALLMFPNGKAPGNDVLTAKFYKGFWNLLVNNSLTP